MKKHHNKVIQLIIVCAALNLAAGNAFAKNDKTLDFRNQKKTLEIAKMQDFHLQNAKYKIAQQQLSYAWGDLAYVLCKIPNHHIALQEMLKIAPQIHKEEELRKYFEKAIRLFPDDQELQAMYRSIK
jgi:hypothetical protein